MTTAWDSSVRSCPMGRLRAIQQRTGRVALTVLGMSLVLLGCTLEDSGITEVALVNGQVTPLTNDGEAPEGFERRKITFDCLAAEPDVCIRLVGNGIDETRDGGTTWVTTWRIDPTESWVASVADTPSNVRPSDLVVTPDDEVHVAVGLPVLVVRNAAGTWAPSRGDIRVFPLGLWFFAVGSVFSLGLALAWRQTRRVRTAVVIGGASTIGAILAASDPTSPALVPLAIIVTIASLSLLGTVGQPQQDRRDSAAGLKQSLLTIALGMGAMSTILAVWSNGRTPWSFAVGATTGLALLTLIIVAALASRERSKDASRPQISGIRHP